MSEASDLINVATDVTGKQTYNGYETVHEALWNLEPEFKVLDFADRMVLSIEVLNDLEEDEYPHFYYTFDEYGGEIICAIFAEEDLITPLLEWYWKDLKDAGIMSSLYDVKGLQQHLVKMGELLPKDELTLVH